MDWVSLVSEWWDWLDWSGGGGGLGLGCLFFSALGVWDRISRERVWRDWFVLAMMYDMYGSGKRW